MTITNIGPNPVDVNITGEGTARVSINGDGWVTSGTILNNQTLQLRMTTANDGPTTHTATVTVGTVSDSWSTTTRLSMCPGGALSPGDVGCLMPDGTVYAGITPDGNVDMFTTPSDAPTTMKFSENGATSAAANCNGSRVGTGCDTGSANTAILAALNDGNGPYTAANYCANLVVHGHSDWYLPAVNEYAVLYTNKAYIGGFASDYYYSSSHWRGDFVWYHYMGSGYEFYTWMDYDIYKIRCVRK